MSLDDFNTESNDIAAERWLVVPFDQLESATLEAVLEEYITREGTDYGVREIGLEQQKERALSAVRDGEVLIVFDQIQQSVQLVDRSDYQQLMGE